jgi:hypothetical protein
MDSSQGSPFGFILEFQLARCVAAIVWICEVPEGHIVMGVDKEIRSPETSFCGDLPVTLLRCICSSIYWYHQRYLDTPSSYSERELFDGVSGTEKGPDAEDSTCNQRAFVLPFVKL